MVVSVTKKNNNQKAVYIHTEFVKLESALKLANAVESGGMAKSVIQGGEVLVNSEVCTMRGKKLYPNDTFQFMGETYLICNYEA